MWYQFTTDADGGDMTVTIDYEEINGVEYLFSYLGAQVFEGQCGSFTSIWCNPVEIDNNTLTLSGLEGNTTYYFRVFPLSSSGNYAPIDFMLSAEGTALSPSSAAPEPVGEGVLGKLRVFPSPASSRITVQIDSPVGGEARLVLLYATGRRVGIRSVDLQAGDNRFEWPVADLPAGLYAVWVESAGGRYEAARWVKE